MNKFAKFLFLMLSAIIILSVTVVTLVSGFAADVPAFSLNIVEDTASYAIVSVRLEEGAFTSVDLSIKGENGKTGNCIYIVEADDFDAVVKQIKYAGGQCVSAPYTSGKSGQFSAALTDAFSEENGEIVICKFEKTTSDRITDGDITLEITYCIDEEGKEVTPSVVNRFLEYPTEELTEKSTESPTEKPTEESTEAPTEAPTEVPTEPPTEDPTEPAADAIRNITADDVYLYESADSETVYTSTWNEETEEYESVEYQFFYEYKCMPETVHVEYMDGRTKDYEPYELEEEYGEWLSCSTDQSYENQWGVGEHTAALSFMNREYNYKIVILENPIEKIEVDAVHLIENADGDLQTDCIYNPERDEYEDTDSYFVYDVRPDYYTVYFKDGTIKVFNGWESPYERYSFQMQTNQSFDNQWHTGTYSATFTLMGVSCDYNVEISETPVDRITVNDLMLYEDADCYTEYQYYWDEVNECDASVPFKKYRTSPKTFTVVFKDGTTEEYEPWVSVNDRYYAEVTDDQSSENQWGIGTHKAVLSFMGKSCEFNVIIKENPVDSFAVDDINLAECRDGSWINESYYDEETDSFIENQFYNYDSTPQHVTVRFKDGSVVEGSVIDIYNETGYEVWQQDNQGEGVQWSAGSHEVGATFMGKETTYNAVVEPVSERDKYVELQISGTKELVLTFIKADGNKEVYHAKNLLGLPYGDVAGEGALIDTVEGRTFEAFISYFYDEKKDETDSLKSQSICIYGLQSNELNGNTWIANNIYRNSYVELNSISIQSMPDQTEYHQNFEFDSTGMVIVANYNFGSVPVTEYNVSYDFSEAGNRAVTITYEDCGVTVSAEFEVTVYEHTLIHINIPASCSGAGTECDFCTECMEKLNVISTPKAEHNLTHISIEATCTEAGYEYDICENCNQKLNLIEHPAKGHSLIHVHTDVTCTTAGEDYDLCERCGEKFNYVVTPVTGHESKHIIIPGNCLVNGMEFDYCTHCNEQYNQKIIIGEHSYGNWEIVKNSTAGEEVLCQHVCSLCGNTEKILLPNNLKNCTVENQFIYGFAPRLSENSFYSEYVNSTENVNVQTVNKNCVGTGTVVSVSYGEYGSSNYEIVIFGDVNGDGFYDGRDSMIVSCLANGMLSRENVSEAEYMAADCNHDGVIDQLDVDILNQAGVLLAEIDQTRSEEELIATSSAYVEYLNLIDQTFEAETAEVVEDEPVDPGYTFNFFDMVLSFIKKIITTVINYFK